MRVGWGWLGNQYIIGYSFCHMQQTLPTALTRRRRQDLYDKLNINAVMPSDEIGSLLPTLLKSLNPI